jgi:nitrite reductase (NADH) small subunit
LDTLVEGRTTRRIDVCPVGALADGERRLVDIGTRTVAVFNVGGEYHALPNVCSHQLGPLCEGTVSGSLYAGPETEWRREWRYEGEVVTCPWHGLEFHIPTGRCLAHPEVKLRTYEVVVEDDTVKLIA